MISNIPTIPLCVPICATGFYLSIIIIMSPTLNAFNVFKSVSPEKSLIKQVEIPLVFEPRSVVGIRYKDIN